MTSTTQSPPTSTRKRGAFWRVLFVILGLFLAGAALAAILWTVARSSDTRTETFSGVIDRVVIEVNGRVSLEPAETAEVTVEREWLIANAPDVEMTLEAGVLRVTAECGWFQMVCQTHVTATVPADAEVVVQTAAGDVEVAGFTSGVDLTTSAGNVIVDIAGPAVLRSSAGRIEGTVTDGDVDAQTSAGRIELDVAGAFTRVSAVTSAGNVRLTVPDDTYRVDATTSAGSVTTNVATDPDASRQIFARSSAGSITIDRR